MNQKFEILSLPLAPSFLVKPFISIDNRGSFLKEFSYDFLIRNNIDFKIKEVFMTASSKNVIRAIHFQKIKEQGKIIRCVRGSIYDVIVDLRPESKNFKKHYSIELNDKNNLALFVPKGFGHGFITLTENTIVSYKVDQYYSKEQDRSIRFDDNKLKIDWKGLTPILSEKDLKAPLLKNSDVNFKYTL